MNRITIVIVCLFLCISSSVHAQETNAKIGFQDYPEQEIYLGKTVTPNFKSHPKAKKYHAHFLEAAKKKPDFAGRYIVVTWGCGSPCLEIAFLDAKTTS